MKILENSNLEKLKNQIKKTEKPVIVKALDDKFNRKALEYGKFDILLGIESGKRKNKLRQIDSGLNHVLAKIAAKNSVAIGIDMKELSSLNKKEKAERISRIIRNINICRKAKAKLAILNAKDKKDALNLLISLGSSTQQAKEAVYA